MPQLFDLARSLIAKLINYFFPQPIAIVCAAHNVSPDAEADIFRVTSLVDLVTTPALPPGLPWLDYSPPLLKKHGLVLGYEYNYGDGTYLWSYYNPQFLTEYSAAFDEAADSVFNMYVAMVSAGHGALYLGSDQRLIDYGLDE